MVFRNSIQGYLGQLVAVVTAMAVTVWLYVGRTDFTR
jgi:type IV secretory pathway VirB2 component (pilin)